MLQDLCTYGRYTQEPLCTFGRYASVHLYLYLRQVYSSHSVPTAGILCCHSISMAIILQYLFTNDWGILWYLCTFPWKIGREVVKWSEICSHDITVRARNCNCTSNRNCTHVPVLEWPMVPRRGLTSARDFLSFSICRIEAEFLDVIVEFSSLLFTVTSTNRFYPPPPWEK